MGQIVYVMGHKNPDTDSICSAIGYAELKNKLGMKAIPVRLGKVNRETEFVLKYFGVKIPMFLNDVKTQVSDLNIDIINPVSADISIKTAWDIMAKNNLKSLPVVDENERFLGIVTLSDITNKYMDTLMSNMIAASKTPLQNIIETINGKVLSENQEQIVTSGKVVIAAMTPEVMAPFIEKGDIVLLGNRKDNQLKAVELGAKCIIVTCGAQINKDVIEYAQEKNCIVLVTTYDTFTTARLINQSIPIGYTMTSKNVISFYIYDTIDDIKDKMIQTRFRSYPVVDRNNRIKGFISRYHLINQKKKMVILLDHNERLHTVDGIEQAEILEVIDHHRIGDIQTSNPVYFKNEPVGSTSTIIANQFFDNGIKPSKKIAGILCAAIISDTILFKSPTSTYIDSATSKKLAEIAGIDIEDFAGKMFTAGSTLRDISPEELLFSDFKEYELGKNKIGIGQISTADTDSIQEVKGGLLAYLKEININKGYDILMFLITDIFNEGSEVLFVGRNIKLIAKALKIDLGQNNCIYLKGVVSRKKQIVPYLASAAQE